MYPDIDEHVLANVWNRIQKKPIQTLNINLLSNEPVFNRDADLYHFFTYMKMLPCHKIKFENAARTFMVFSDVRFEHHIVILRIVESDKIKCSFSEPEC